jgi:hypothetical protein
MRKFDLEKGESMADPLFHISEAGSTQGSSVPWSGAPLVYKSHHFGFKMTLSGTLAFYLCFGILCRVVVARRGAGYKKPFFVCVCVCMCVSCFAETRSHYVSQASHKLVILLLQPPESWDYRWASPCLASESPDS